MAVTDSIFIDVAMTSMKLQVSEFTNIYSFIGALCTVMQFKK